MLCQECRVRPATVKITTIAGQTKEELHLCEECARKRGEVEFGGEGQISLGEMLAAFLHQQGVVKPATSEEPGPGPCPACGLTYERLARTGKLGCSECFTHFGPQLRSILRHVHGSARHVGRMPKRGGGPLRIQHDISRLKRDLAACVQAEDFERAAQLRDEIRQLELSVAQASATATPAPKEEVDPA
jgi:protein arginine kinase activator